MKWSRLIQQGVCCCILTPSVSFHVHFKPKRHPRKGRIMASQQQNINNDDNNAAIVQKEEEEEPYYQVLDNINRIFCISDLHTDHSENLEWLRRKQKQQQQQSDGMNMMKMNPDTDLIIVAGDISHEYDRFSETLTVLRQCGKVLFVPGNHEAWLNKHDKHHHHHHVHHEHHHHKGNSSKLATNTTKSSSTSLDKLNRIYKLCQEHDVYTKPLFIRGRHPLWILPLQSWYDGTLSFAEEHCQDFNHWPWVDFIRCEWPSPLPSQQSPLLVSSSSEKINGKNNGRIPMGLTEYFLQQNEEYLQHIRPMILQQQPQQTSSTSSCNNVSILTVSHFLPNFQSLPDWKDLSATEFNVHEWLDHGGPGVSAKFSKVAGSVLLGEQIRSIMSLVVDNDRNDAKNTGGVGDGAPSSTAPVAGSVSKSTLGAATANGSGSSRIHVFGHSHRPKDFTFQGIRYIHNPLGKPKERLTHTVSPNVDFQLLWENNSNNDDGGEVAGTTLLRYWEECAGGKEALWERFAQMNPGRYQRLERKRKRAPGGAKLKKESSKHDTPT